MKEQIQQMIYNLNEKVGVHWTNEDKLKFAELIVRECAEAVESSAWHLPRGYKAKDQAEFVRKHFGVK